MSITAMKQALEALEQIKPLYSRHDAKAILRQAIAEVEKQEPVYAYPDPDALNAAYIMGVQDGKKMREPMTDEQIQEVVGADANFWATSKLWIISIVRAIEAAHGIKEKNT